MKVPNSQFFCLQISSPYDTAVDVACGTGVSTEALSPYFKNVIGIKRKDIQENYAYRSVGLYNIIYRYNWVNYSKAIFAS